MQAEQLPKTLQMFREGLYRSHIPFQFGDKYLVDHPNMDKPNMIAYRKCYLQAKISLRKEGPPGSENARKKGHKGKGFENNRAQVYGDESFVNLHHTADKMLNVKGEKAHRRSGVGERLCYSDFMVVKNDTSNYGGTADVAIELLRNAFLCFRASGTGKGKGKEPTVAQIKEALQGIGVTPAKGKKQVMIDQFRDESTKFWLLPLASRPNFSDQVMDNFLNVDRYYREIQADDDKLSCDNQLELLDYHGHFESERWEKYFEHCCSIMLSDHGECDIFIDGASYHKRILNPVPNAKHKVAVIKDWLRANNLLTAEVDGMNKDGLLEVVKANKPKKRYAAMEIAAKYGHRVFYTPPYAKESQPIEWLWAQWKSPIGRNPVSTMAELEERIHASRLKSEGMMNAGMMKFYKEVLDWEDATYLKLQCSLPHDALDWQAIVPQ